MNKEELINIITNNEKFDGAHNIRIDGKLDKRQNSENISIISKTDKDGIDIIVKDNSQGERVAIPVIITKGDITDKVYNDFYIGENCDVLIVAGCGIDNCSNCDSSHSGIHTFYVGKNSKVKYIENHYGHGDGTGKKVFDPETIIYLENGAEMTLNTTQIEGVDNTHRITKAYIKENAVLKINEKIMTSGEEKAYSDFYVELNGDDSKATLSSRVVAKDNSIQDFKSSMQGNSKCFGRVECDAIIVGNAKVSSTPAINANCSDATLNHEATIGKIAGEQLLKLLTLGLDEKQAEEEIIKGFLR